MFSEFRTPSTLSVENDHYYLTQHIFRISDPLPPLPPPPLLNSYWRKNDLLDIEGLSEVWFLSTLVLEYFTLQFAAAGGSCIPDVMQSQGLAFFSPALVAG